jgi:hypothetical protein
MGSHLPLRGYRYVPRFLLHSLKIRRQLAQADGLIGYALNAQLLRKEFWTVSVWRTRDDLERFAKANPHSTITQTKPRRMAESAFVFWTCEGRETPVAWDVVAEHMRAPIG